MGGAGGPVKHYSIIMTEHIKIVKVGGNIINSPAALQAFLKEFAALEGKKILVHGGGALATELAARLGITQQMIDGRRVTDAETLKIVTMVYAGYVNKQVVSGLQSYGCNAIGICGADGHIITARRRTFPADFGFAGDIDRVDTDALSALLLHFDTVVVAPLTMDVSGQLLNTNADTIARSVAAALSAAAPCELIYTFEKNGVLQDVEQPDSVIPLLTAAHYQQLREEQRIFAGMLPKLDNAFLALREGVGSVYIGPADQLKALSEGRCGTKIIL